LIQSKAKTWQMNRSYTKAEMPDFSWHNKMENNSPTKIPNSHKISQNDSKIPNDQEINQILKTQVLPKYTKIGLFGIEINILATLYPNFLFIKNFIASTTITREMKCERPRNVSPKWSQNGLRFDYRNQCISS
jgi:beta-lactamase regulating signal transducer with metallopeptidase domain